LPAAAGFPVDFAEMLATAVANGVKKALEAVADQPHRIKRKKGLQWWDDARIKDITPAVRMSGNFLDTKRDESGQYCANRTEWVQMKVKFVDTRAWPAFPTSSKLHPEYAAASCCFCDSLSICVFMLVL
jgi:hypothetical protein